jgi:hypothetical protein
MLSIANAEVPPSYQISIADWVGSINDGKITSEEAFYLVGCLVY